MPIPFRVAFICTGNICRSPMAEVALRHVAREVALATPLLVTSAGTANWHVGRPMDPRARRALDRAGFHEVGSPARYADAAYLDEQDLIIVMTKEHRRDVLARRTSSVATVELLRNLLEAGSELDVADPYYGDDQDFDACLAQLTRAVRSWTSEFRQQRGAWPREV